MTELADLHRFLKRGYVRMRDAPRLRPPHHLTAEQQAATVCLAQSSPSAQDLETLARDAYAQDRDLPTTAAAGTAVHLASLAAEAEDLLALWVFDLDRYRWWARRADDVQLLALLVRAASSAQRHDGRAST